MPFPRRLLPNLAVVFRLPSAPWQTVGQKLTTYACADEGSEEAWTGLNFSASSPAFSVRTTCVAVRCLDLLQALMPLSPESCLTSEPCMPACYYTCTAHHLSALLATNIPSQANGSSCISI